MIVIKTGLLSCCICE